MKLPHKIGEFMLGGESCEVFISRLRKVNGWRIPAHGSTPTQIKVSHKLFGVRFAKILFHEALHQIKDSLYAALPHTDEKRDESWISVNATQLAILACDPEIMERMQDG